VSRLEIAQTAMSFRDYSLAFMKEDEVPKTGSISILKRNGGDTPIQFNLLERATFRD
jgi:hypothetical protein